MPSTDEEVTEEQTPKEDSEKKEGDAETKADSEKKEDGAEEKAESEKKALTGKPQGGRRKSGAPPTEEPFVRQRLPDPKNKEIFGIADQLVGGSRIKVNCEDGRARLGRIPGKMKRRMWIRTGDLLIIKPWDFQDDKCDIKYRYMRTQSINLAKRGLLPDTVNIFT